MILSGTMVHGYQYRPQLDHGPDMVLGSSLGLDVTMALVGRAGPLISGCPVNPDMAPGLDPNPGHPQPLMAAGASDISAGPGYGRVTG